MNFIKHFMTNKGTIDCNGMTKINGKNAITDNNENSKPFNKHHIDIVENSCSNKPNKIGTTLRSLKDIDVIDRINGTKTIQAC